MKYLSKDSSQGLKKDSRFRMDAPERACNAQMRSVNIGRAPGLSDSEKTYILQDFTPLYTGQVPGYGSRRLISPHTTATGIPVGNPVSDKQLVQAILAVRLFIPRAAINISTRENSALRKTSSGWGYTHVGRLAHRGRGYTASIKTEGQFEVNDTAALPKPRK